MNLLLRVAVGVPLIACICFADGESDDFKLKPKGFFSYEFGQVMKGRNKQTTWLDHTAINDIYTGFGYNVLFSPRTSADVSLALKTYTEFPNRNLPSYTRKQNFYAFLDQASVSHAIIDDGDLKIGLTFGYFPFKYNNDARNLGEYLFRSGTYPQYIINYWDFPKARLSGLNINGKLWNCFSVNLLAFLNTDWIAVKDLNLGFLGSYECANFLEIGLGGTLNSVVSANENLTTPPAGETQYIQNGYMYNYTFRGSKIMARMAIDPKRFFQSDFFGKEDLKVFGEAALLGVKNYPLGTDSVLRFDVMEERIPVMFGLNWPTHQFTSYCILGLMAYGLEPAQSKKTERTAEFGGTFAALGLGLWIIERLFNCNTKLDLLALQAEWFGSRYPNDLLQPVKLNIPLPYPSDTRNDELQPYLKDDNWKWSIYGTKTISRHFFFTFQVASDHLRTFALVAEGQDWEEIFRKPDQWYYMTKFGVSF